MICGISLISYSQFTRSYAIMVCRIHYTAQVRGEIFMRILFELVLLPLLVEILGGVIAEWLIRKLVDKRDKGNR